MAYSMNSVRIVAVSLVCGLAVAGITLIGASSFAIGGALVGVAVSVMVGLEIWERRHR